jgi:hypothetical protein
VREHSDSFEDEGRAGHMIVGLSGGISGAASPERTCKTVLMKGLWCGFGWQQGTLRRCKHSNPSFANSPFNL